MKQRFQDSIKELKITLDEIRINNEPEMKALLKYEIFARRQIEDGCFTVERPGLVKLRVVLLCTNYLASNIFKVLEHIQIPYRLEIDGGSILQTRNFELYPYHASRNSSIETKNSIMREASDITTWFDEFGWQKSDEAQPNSRFIQKCISNQEERFELMSNSKFNFAKLGYVELYIETSTSMIKQWNN